jgi:hypothetical protein
LDTDMSMDGRWYEETQGEDWHPSAK